MITDKEKVNSIISLLDDPDESVFESIKQIIVENFGNFSGILTQKLHSGCSDIEKKRISELAQMSITNIFRNDFLNYTAKLNPEPSLLAGIVLVEKIVDNSFDEYSFTHYLRDLSRKVWLKLNDNTGIEAIRIIREVFENERIYAIDKSHNLSLNGIFANDDKPLNKSLFNLVYLVVCQENSINVRPIFTPSTEKKYTLEIGYVNKEAARLSNIPSRHGALFAIDYNMQIKRDAKILLGEPLPYYKYLKHWQLDRFRTVISNSGKFPGYYSVIMEKITEVLFKNIKY